MHHQAQKSRSDEYRCRSDKIISHNVVNIFLIIGVVYVAKRAAFFIDLKELYLIYFVPEDQARQSMAQLVDGSSYNACDIAAPFSSPQKSVKNSAQIMYCKAYEKDCTDKIEQMNDNIKKHLFHIVSPYAIGA